MIDYPQIRYMGSKYKLLDWIKDELKDLPFNSVLDGFSGSGAVSYMFKQMEKRVYSNDFLHFPYTIARAVIENSNSRITESDLVTLLKPDEHRFRFIENTYRDIFYSDEDLQFLDTLSCNIPKLKCPYKKSLAMSALLRSCSKKQPRGLFTISGDLSRYNDGRRDLKLSIKEHFIEQIEVYNNTVFNNNLENRAFHGDIFNFDTQNNPIDLVYLDPPYIPKSDDNCYIKRYHFLEGLSKYWKDEKINYNTKTRKINKKYTPFSYKRDAEQTFDNLFNKFKQSTIVLSYSSNSYPDLDNLTNIMHRYKQTITIKTKEHRYHIGNHKNAKRTKTEEYLIIGE